MKQRRTLLFAIPAVLLLAIFFGWPLLRILLLSFGAPRYTLSHYAGFFAERAYLVITGRTLTIAISVTLLTLILAYPVAYCMSAASGAWRRIILTLVLVSYLTSLLVRTYAWVVLLGDAGPINALLMALGLTDAPIELIYNRFGTIVGMVQVLLPIMILPVFASMQRINPELPRAARSLGAGPLRLFFRVYLPQTAPGVRSGCTLVFMIAIGFYILPLALGGLGDVMISNLVAQQVLSANNFPLASVLAFALLAVAFALMGMVSLILKWAGRPIERKDGTPAFRGRIVGRATTYLSGLARRRRPTSRTLDFAKIGSGAGSVVLATMVAPSVIVTIMSFGADDFLAFPPSGFSLRWYRSFFGSSEWLGATAVSAEIAVASAALALLFGTGAAFSIARSTSRWMSRGLHGFALAPLVIPPVVLAIGSFSTLASLGLIGTPIALILVHAMLCVPLVVVIMLAAFENLDRRLELASQSLGASGWMTIRSVMLPLLLPSVLSSALFSFIGSFDEVVVTSFIAGTNLRTLPLKMFEDLRNQVDPTIAAVSVLLTSLPILLLPFLKTGLGSKADLASSK